MTTPPKPPQPALLPRDALVRLTAAALLVAALLYLVVFWQPQVPTVDPTELANLDEPLFAVPQIDSQLLAKALDSTREERLFLEAEPLSHLLAQSLNVSPAAARAMGMPLHPLPVADVRAAPKEWRGRWLFWRGKVEDLAGPRPGNPVPGYGIYEATLRLADGSAVLFTFSKPPAEGVHVGGWARAEGFLLKLRDVAYPRELTSTPLLVGAELQLDYETWAPQKQIDPERLAHVIDTRTEGDRIEPSADSWRSIDDDQSLPLWHLGAHARDADPRSSDEWRRVPALNAQEAWDAFKQNRVERGTPMRVLGTLAALRTIAAKPNPAGIDEWTEAWLQVRDLHGKTIPVWVPKSVRMPLATTLEVRGYYYRRYSYESRSGQQYWTPLFVAADLDPFVFDTATAMKEIGVYVMGGTVLIVAFAFLYVRGERRRTAAGEDALIARRRRRRSRVAAAAPIQ